LLLLSPFDLSEFAFGCAEPLGLISLITSEKSSLKFIWEDTDLSEPLEGEEVETMAFPFLGAWWALIFNLLLALEGIIGESTRISSKNCLIGGGEGKDKLG
jgi:hypothetical protein